MNVFLNNNLYAKEELSELLEPGFLFGWGVFETMRARNGNIVHQTEHLRRLEAGLKTLGIAVPDVDIPQTVVDLLAANDLCSTDAYIRITAYKKRKGTGCIIYTDRFGYYPPESYQRGFTAVLSGYPRGDREEFRAVKSLSYGYNRLAWLSAQEQGKDEALVVNNQGVVIGGARSNLFLVRGNEVVTPKKSSAGFFCGIIQEKVCEVISQMSLPLTEREISPQDIKNSDEAFLTSSLLYVMPLVEFEGVPLSGGKPGEMTRRILERYRESRDG